MRRKSPRRRLLRVEQKISLRLWDSLPTRERTERLPPRQQKRGRLPEGLCQRKKRLRWPGGFKKWRKRGSEAFSLARASPKHVRTRGRYSRQRHVWPRRSSGKPDDPTTS